jgi:dolichol-phosphate mannosyltransferase
MKTITIVCPVFNESENLIKFIKEFDEIIYKYKNKYNIDYLFLDNSSTDNSLEILKGVIQKRSDIRIISYIKNFGAMKSIYTGIIKSNADAIAIFDCDLQDPPDLLEKFIECWEDGYYFVYGKRRSRIEFLMLTILRKIYKLIEKNINGNNIEIESGAWFLDKIIINLIKQNSRYDPYIPGLLSRIAYKIKSVPYDRSARENGQSKFNFFSYLSYSRDGLTSGSITPLRISIFFGISLFFSSLIFAIYFLYIKLFTSLIFAEGIAAILILMLTMFSFTFLMLGIIGEYLGKIYLSHQDSQIAIIDFDSSDIIN